MSKDRLVIFDTTLRDGEQSPGASMTKDEKVRIAKALERLRVDVIEAGFAVASPGDFEAVKAVASVITESTVCSLARALDKDIEAAAAAIAPAPRRRIHTFIATSPIHMQHKLKMTPEQVVEQAIYAVKKARQYTDDVEFSAEDAGRSDLDFLARVYEAAIQAGATTCNFPDTVGYNLPFQIEDTIRQLLTKIPSADRAIFSVHCHNDLGLAVANSLAAVRAGCRQIECTINGLGERAGNTSLEEVVMAIKTRADIVDVETQIATQHIVPASRLVSSITGFPVQPNKAIVGANAFAHESGIHQDGVLKHRETYEIMRAEDVGWHANKMVMGKHSGRAAFKSRLEDLGIVLPSDDALNEAFARFKDLADRKHEIFDEDIQALMNAQQAESSAARFELLDLEVTSKMGVPPTAHLELKVDGESIKTTAKGDGPVDAALRAIEAVARSGADLQLYSVNAITTGTDSQGEVTVRLERAGRIVNGLGADTDIVVASAKAYLHALNLIERPLERQHPQHVAGI
ncbi:MAG: 2-isopropylmalate synthase [Gammaproteobacteria bacterium]|nr:2-isopropylmalate synthase [Gammaproteobacteria bacterium]